jgi:RNA polymerase sigma factor (sigma-70 family)
MARRSFFRLLSAATPAGDHVPDAELLSRFTHSRDPAAFELLVRRHADAVWSAAVRVLRNEADAEDAFQAAFLVLARKAGSVRGACVGGWLHRVAVNAALKLKADSRRRPAGGLSDDVPEDRPADAGRSPDPELAAVVHQELSQLPDRYRLPVVLCDLEGQTHAEAARSLGWPVGSVSGRLSRARDILRDRLARRGVAAPVVIAAVAAPSGAVNAAASAVSGAVVSPVVMSLTEGVLSAMRVAKLKLTAAVAAGLLGLAGVGTVAVLAQGPGKSTSEPAAAAGAAGLPRAGEAPPIVETDNGITAFPELEPASLEDLMAKCPLLFDAKDISTDPKDPPLRQLQKARLNAVLADVRLVTQAVKAGRASPSDEILALCGRIMPAAADLFSDPKELRPWYVEWVRVTKWAEKVTLARVQAGTDHRGAVNRARFARLEAEIALHKLTLPARPAGGAGR